MFNLIEVNNNIEVKNDINIGLGGNSQKGHSLKYVFVRREGVNNIKFSIYLVNKGDVLINRIWFSAFIGIPKTKFGPGLDDQEDLYIKPFWNNHLSCWTKESFKLPPETVLEILYFDIPKESLFKGGSLEFFYGSEYTERINFRASWENGEIKDNLSELNINSFLEFLKIKNQDNLSFLEKIKLYFNKIRNGKI